MRAYLLGVATPFVTVAVFFVAVFAFHWLNWWRVQDKPGFHGGRGRQHDFDRFMPDEGEWYPRSRHTHWWPPDTPWWLIGLVEPLRVRRCLSDPHKRPATPFEVDA